jgi:uracil DNA glycosylase
VEEALKEEFEKDYFGKLPTFVKAEYSTKQIFPAVRKFSMLSTSVRSTR